MTAHVTDDTLDAAARVVAARLNRLVIDRGLVQQRPKERRRAEVELARAKREVLYERDRLVGRG